MKDRAMGLFTAAILLASIWAVLVAASDMYADFQKSRTPLNTAIMRCAESPYAAMVLVDRSVYVCDELPLEVR